MNKVEEFFLNDFDSEDTHYIGEILELLPCGILNKTHTGLGATYLEMNCDRNSIIVEPSIAIASNKVINHNKKCDKVERLKFRRILYFGTIPAIGKRISIKHVRSYLNNENITYKKLYV